MSLHYFEADLLTSFELAMHLTVEGRLGQRLQQLET